MPWKNNKVLLSQVGLAQGKYLGSLDSRNQKRLQVSIGRMGEWKILFSFSGIYISSPAVKDRSGSKVLPPTLMEK